MAEIPDLPPLENHKAIDLYRMTGIDPLENYKAVQPAFSVGPSTAHQ